MALALLIIAVLTVVIVYATIPYLNYIFGALIFFVIFRSLFHFFLRRARLRKQFAAGLVIIISIFVVLIPLYFLLSEIISEIQQLLLNQTSIIASLESGAYFLTHFLSRLNIPVDIFQAKIEERAIEVVSQAVNYMSLFILSSIQNLSYQSIGLFFLWEAIATILSFLPVVGAPFVWVPAIIVQLLQGDYIAGICILATGLFISVIDNFLRPIIQKKVGEIHPFLSLLGVVIGVSLFGLIGIVTGPLLLSYFILTVQMFSREYLS